jgi:hypothetical protein
VIHLPGRWSIDDPLLACTLSLSSATWLWLELGPWK